MPSQHCLTKYRYRPQNLNMLFDCLFVFQPKGPMQMNHIVVDRARDEKLSSCIQLSEQAIPADLDVY